MKGEKTKKEISVTLPVISKVRNESEFRTAKCVAKAYGDAISVMERELEKLRGKLSEYQEKKGKK